MIWLLLVIFQFKHFLADYVLQTPYMLGKFKDKDWIVPLSSHCSVQAIFTFLITSTVLACSNIYFGYILFITVLDFTIHFIMDRIKASPKMLGRYESLSKEQFKGLIESRSLATQGINYKQSIPLMTESLRLVEEIDLKFKGNKYFWWSLGLDQMVHHLTDILIVYLIIGKLI